MFQFFNDFGFTCVVNERCDELRADKNMYYRKIPNSDCDYLVIANELFMVKWEKARTPMDSIYSVILVGGRDRQGETVS